MALTPEQKAANKQAALARDAAYRARRKAYTAAYDAAVKPYEFDSLCPAPEVRVFQELNSCENRARDERDAADAALVQRIATLEAERRALRAAPLPYTQERREAAALVRQLHEEKVQAVNAAYPDIAGMYSAVAWETKVKKLREEGVL